MSTLQSLIGEDCEVAFGDLSQSERAALRLKVISDLDEAERLVPAWRELFDRCEDASIYDTPEFVLASYRHLIAPTGVPQLVTFWRRDGLIGLIPLYRHPTKVYGLRVWALSHVASLQGDCPTILGLDRPLLWTALHRVLAHVMPNWDVFVLAEQEMNDHALIREFRQDPGFRLFEWDESHRYLSETEVPFDELVRRLVRLGLERFQQRRGLRTVDTYDSPGQGK